MKKRIYLTSINLVVALVCYVFGCKPKAESEKHPIKSYSFVSDLTKADTLSNDLQNDEHALKPSRREPDFSINDRDRMLHLYCGLYGNLQKVKELLNSGINVNQLDDSNEAPLHYAAAYGQIDICDFLISKGAKVNVLNKFKETPLFSAAIHRQTLAAKYLIEHGAEIDVKNNSGYTPLYIAAKQGGVHTANILLDNGAVIDIHIASMLGHAKFLKKILEDSTKDIENKDPRDDTYGDTPLINAATRAHLEAVKILLSFGAKPNSKDSTGASAIFWSSLLDKNIEVVKFLIENGATIDSADLNGDTPLHKTAIIGAPKTAIYLLSKGHPVSPKNKEGKTPLQIAIEKNKDEIIEILKKNGAEIKKYNE